MPHGAPSDPNALHDHHDEHHSHATHAPIIDEPRPSIFSNFIAIIGLIILIVIVIWGLVHLVSLSQGWFSSLFGGAKITVSAPAQVNTGEQFTVSWKYSTKEKGNYAFLYQCKSGLTVKNSASATIPCGSAYTVGSATSLTLTPALENLASTTMPVTVVFLPNATSSERVQGSASVVVRNPAIVPAVQTPTTKPATTPVTTKPANTNTPANTANTANAPASPADLAVRMIAIGVIDRTTGVFVNRAPMYADDIAAAQFDIVNVGGSASGMYYFNADLPTFGGYTYSSPAQSPLAPGDHVINTLRFTQANPAGGAVIVRILTSDVDAMNNSASMWMPASNYQYQQTYQYPQQYGYPYQYNNQYTQPQPIYYSQPIQYGQQYPYSQQGAYYPYAY